MCLLDEDKNNLVTEWDVSGIPPEHRDGVYVSMRDHLDARPWVLKRKQYSSRNNLSVTRKWYLSCTFFIHTSSLNVPKLKQFYMMLDTKYLMLPDLVRLNTIRRKKVSIERCEAFISGPINAHWLKHFKNLKRKMISQIR